MHHKICNKITIKFHCKIKYNYDVIISHKTYFNMTHLAFQCQESDFHKLTFLYLYTVYTLNILLHHKKGINQLIKFKVYKLERTFAENSFN